MTVRSTLHDARTRSKDQVKQAREQVIVYNERLADTVTSRFPQVESRLSGRLPSPLEVVERYYDLVGHFYETNRDFVTRLASAWDRSDDDAPTVDGKPLAEKPVAGKPLAGKPVAGKPLAEKPVVKKPAAKKAPAAKRSARSGTGTSAGRKSTRIDSPAVADETTTS